MLCILLCLAGQRQSKFAVGPGSRYAAQSARWHARLGFARRAEADRSHDAASAALRSGRRAERRSAALLARLEDIQRREPDREHEYAMAEVAYITATQAEKLHRRTSAGVLWHGADSCVSVFVRAGAGSTEQGVRVGHAKLETSGSSLNPYDPQFRGASDLYNQSLEGMLRLVRQEGELRPGMSRTVKTANHTCSFDVVMHSTGWQPDDIDRLRVCQRLQGARVCETTTTRTGWACR